MNEINGVEADQSPSLAALAAALAKAQGLMAGAKKDATNPHFKSKYADLASVWEACRDALSVNGLAVIQLPGSAGKDVMVTTLLLHSSGEWIRSRYTMPVTQPGAQGVGSALTYARRYSLAAMVGVAPEDDDGNAASSPRPGDWGKPSSPPASPPATPPVEKRTAEVKAKVAAARKLVIEPDGSEWFEKIRALGRRHNIEGSRLSSHCKGAGVTKTKPEEFTEADFNTVAASLAYLDASPGKEMNQ